MDAPGTPRMTGPMWMPVDPPSLPGLLAWHPQPYAIYPLLFALLAVLYLVGVARLRRQGVHWPIGRTVSWLVGVATVVWVTGTGIEGYGMLLFSVHMFQHMVLTMVSPVFLVLGAPVTLALRALPRGRGRSGALRRGITRALNSRVAAALAHPAFTLPMLIFSLYGIYYTSVFDLLMASVWGHYFMLAHFLLTGVFFFGPVLKTDLWPGPKSHVLRLMLMLVSMPFHAFFGITLMMSSSPLVDFYAHPPSAWNLDVMHDQLWGGGLTWAFGDVPALIVAVALAVSWYCADARQADRLDRKAARDGDADLAAYNAHLRRLAQADEAEPAGPAGQVRDGERRWSAAASQARSDSLR